MATSLLSMLLTSTTNLADVLTIINAMEVAAARRHRARILELMSVQIFQVWTFGGVLNPSRVNVSDIS